MKIEIFNKKSIFIKSYPKKKVSVSNLVISQVLFILYIILEKFISEVIIIRSSLSFLIIHSL